MPFRSGFEFPSENDFEELRDELNIIFELYNIPYYIRSSVLGGRTKIIDQVINSDNLLKVCNSMCDAGCQDAPRVLNSLKALSYFFNDVSKYTDFPE